MDETEDVTCEDHNSTASSTFSSEDIQPEVRDQFVKLADALKETNQNLLTFEFMLSQYRKLARIEPFTVSQQSEQQQQPDQQSTKQVVHPESESSVEVLEQLRCLTLAVANLQQPQSTSKELSVNVTNEDVTHRLIEEVHTIRGQLQQLGEANEAVAFLRDKIETLERSIEDKNRLIEGLTEGHKRLTSQLAEERDKCLELDRKLENEKRAATQVGKDITKYVERMNELELKVQSTEPKMLELAEKSELCRKLTRENQELQQQLLERGKMIEEKPKLNEFDEKVKALESRIRSEAQEKESLKTTIEILKDQLYECRQLNDSRTTLNETSFCRTCIDGNGSDTLEEAAKRVQELAVDIQRRTEADIDRLSTQNESLLAENRSLEESLRHEQNLRHTLETKVTVCQQEIR
jgi:chromosome segregation ATPase